jgi:hypothetical protein
MQTMVNLIGIPLARLDLEYGPFDFDVKSIEAKVESGKKGNFALGYLKEPTGGFVVKYVGRSDTDLKEDLLFNLPKSSTRQKFKFDYAQTEKEAFEKECKNYHDFRKQLENEQHPRRPKDKNYPCPVQGCTEFS